MLVILDEAKGRRGERLKKKKRETTRFDAGEKSHVWIHICVPPRTSLVHGLRGASFAF
jgi:hypothetical protein